MPTAKAKTKTRASSRMKLDPKTARDLAKITREKEPAVKPLAEVEDDFTEEGLAILRRIETIEMRIADYEEEQSTLKAKALPLLKAAGHKSIRGALGVTIGWRKNSPKRTFDQKWAIGTLLKKGVKAAEIEKHYDETQPKTPESLAITRPKAEKATAAEQEG